MKREKDVAKKYGHKLDLSSQLAALAKEIRVERQNKVAVALLSKGRGEIISAFGAAK